MKALSKIVLSLAFVSCFALPLSAQEHVAIVEDISSDRADIQFMDFIEQGREITLKADETITLGYVLSCNRESITGGKIKVGKKQSVVTGGKVVKEKVECDEKPMVLAMASAQESGAVVYRAIKFPGQDAKRKPKPRPDRVIYSVAPILRLKDKVSKLTIKNLDNDSEQYEFTDVKKVLDLGDMGVTLKAGGMYCVNADSKKMVFRVMPTAKDAKAPVLSRLLPM